MLKISAKEESALELYLQEIYKTLRDTREDFMDCVATLNLGRDDFACRGAVTFRTKEECLQSCAAVRYIAARNMAALRSAERTQRR